MIGIGEHGLASDMISQEAFAAAYSYLLPFIEVVEDKLAQDVTFFEATTALAFDWMASETVDAAVLEVGLGGRWDATNVADSQVAILTTIGVDHTRFLGETPEEIATEKVGVIKAGAKVVSGVQSDEVSAVIRTEADALAAQLHLLGQDFAVRSDVPALGGRSVGIDGLFARYEELFLPLHGPHQATNLALAIAASESFVERPLDDAALSSALQTVTSAGRMEVVRRSPLVVLDGAHNPDAARALALALHPTFGERKTTFVVTIFADKDASGILSALAPVADRMILTKMTDEREVADPVELSADRSLAQVETAVIEDLDEAIDMAISMSLDDELIVVTGSLHGVGQARNHLLGNID